MPFGELFDSYEQMAQKCPCSGPAPLLDAVTGHCDSWPSGALHIERFAAKDLEEPGRAEGSRWS
nr:hypothetical protein [Rhodococcus jostii]